jgi:hypothetical protein
VREAESGAMRQRSRGREQRMNKEGNEIKNNRVLWRIFGPKRDEVTGEWRRLHNEEVHDLYSSPSIIRIMKARRMRWAGHVARMGRRGTRIGCWWESQREGGD